MRYLLDAALFLAAYALAASLFDSAAWGLAAGVILAGSWEALQGKRN